MHIPDSNVNGVDRLALRNACADDETPTMIPIASVAALSPINSMANVNWDDSKTKMILGSVVVAPNSIAPNTDARTEVCNGEANRCPRPSITRVFYQVWS